MRKLLFLVIIFIPLLIIGILIYKNINTTPQNSIAFNPTPEESVIPQSTITINNMSFSWYEVNTDKLKLIPNYSERLLAKEIINQYSCQFLTNAAFYSTENKPLGLIISDGDTLSGYQTNSLMDGVLSINDLSTPRITRTNPVDHLNIAVQSGPIVKENGQNINLDISSDKESRRVLAGITGENKLFFIVVYQKDSEFLGPKLGDIPNLISSFEKESGITFADVINLDGGSASAFVSKNIQLYEFNPVGAFFCQS